ncbi:MAG: hypothetical protein V1492_06115 [Candidatus Micrarchaeota archaeon]
MKKLIALLFLLCAAQALYTEPPFADVLSWNNAKATELNDLYLQNFSHQDNLSLDWYSRPMVVRGSMALAGFNLLLDNSTNGSALLIIGRGARANHLEDVNGAVCDWKRTTDSLCDLDGDGCTETEREFHAYSHWFINFTFRNKSVVVEPPYETLGLFGHSYNHTIANNASIPAELVAQMENASGSEPLEVQLTGTMDFVYAFDNRGGGGGSCGSSYEVIERELNFSDTAIVYPAGKQKLYFLETPALGEQWFRNNKISILLLSQRQIYLAKLIKNGTTVASFRLYDFNITENEFGLRRIVTVANDSSPFLGQVNATPTTLEQENHSFAYLYRFAYNFGQELGLNEFKLEAMDVFGGNATTVQKIYSRQLSQGNATETGSRPNWETTRKSFAHQYDTQQTIQLLFGMLGVIILLVFMRFKLQ